MLRKSLAMLLALSCTVMARAQHGTESMAKISLTGTLHERLQEGGFRPVREALAYAPPGFFPENITVTYGATSPASDAPEDGCTTLVLAFTQEEALGHYPLVEELLSYAQNRERAYTLIFLFSTSDSAPLEAGALQGTACFASGTDSPETTAAVAVHLEDGSDSAGIIPGTKGGASPLWLARTLRGACDDAGIRCVFPAFFMAFYRTGLFADDFRTNCFLRNGIMAAGLRVPASEGGLRVLKNYVGSYSAQGTSVWDRNYALLSVRRSEIWLSEDVFVRALLAITVVTLAALCAFSFSSGSLSRRRMRHFARTWYFMPCAVPCIAVIMRAGQLAARCVLRLAPHAHVLLLMALKILILFWILSILVFLLVHRTRLLDNYLCGFLVSSAALLNIFIFCAVDVSLLILFTAEYVILVAVHRMKKIRLASAGLALSALPFLPYIAALLRHSTELRLQRMVLCSPWHDALLSCAAFPLLMLYAKIALRLKVFSLRNNIPARKSLLWLMAFNAAASVAFIASAAMAAALIYAPEKDRPEPPAVTENGPGTERRAHARWKDNVIMGQSYRTLSLSCDEQVIRYAVSVRQDGGTAVYDASLDYSTVSSGGQVTSTFIIPDYPAQSVMIEYAPNVATDSVIIVDTWYAHGGGILHERLELEVPHG